MTGAKEGVPQGDNKAPNRDSTNRLSLQLECQGPGQYVGELVLRSKMDVRVISVVCSLLPREVNVQLNLQSPIRQKIAQEIPITNGSAQEWTVQSRISLDGQDAEESNGASRQKPFTGPSELKIPAGQTKSYLLTFAASKIATVKGSLVLNNVTTNDTYTYILTGQGDDPAAEDHVPIDCSARKALIFPLQVGNFAGIGPPATGGGGGGKMLSYSVKTDLRCVTGPSVFEVPLKGSVEYPLSILCPVGGNFYGTVTFTKNHPDGSDDPFGDYYWYTLEVRADTPSPERLIKVSTQVRCGSAVGMVTHLTCLSYVYIR
jgi:hypothetical protein